MEKKLIKEKVNYDFDWTYGVPIDKLIGDLNVLKGLGVTEIEIEPHESYGSAGVDISAFIERLETEEEVNKRIERKKEIEEHNKRVKQEQYERLKLELGL